MSGRVRLVAASVAALAGFVVFILGLVLLGGWPVAFMIGGLIIMVVGLLVVQT